MDDPRNIFVSQRQNYQQSHQTPTQSGATQQTDTANPQTEGAKPTDTQTEYQQKVEEMKRLAQKYQREGEGQLVKDIISSVIEQKARGQLTNEQLLTFAKRITPMLNADQRDRLNQLVEQLLKL